MRSLVAIPFVFVLLVLVPACGGSSRATAADSVTCRGITGTIHFNPPIHGTSGGGSANETVEFTAGGTGCSASGPGPVSVSRAAITGTLTGGTDSCTGMLKSTLVRASVHWIPPSRASSVLPHASSVLRLVSASDLEAGPYASEGDGFAMAGTAPVTGAFRGSDGRASSTIDLFSDESFSRSSTRAPRVVASPRSGSHRAT